MGNMRIFVHTSMTKEVKIDILKPLLDVFFEIMIDLYLQILEHLKSIKIVFMYLYSWFFTWSRSFNR